ncbi:unnamed protein product [Medioppia subpectinata]|uniref:Uncharacterized protein n=1 Tax=Medioppia subpectinata TaxID=1979941 RepID=A0A7R9KLU9_9ACAR|nr:unnamed protein product [Medioppia subpectinata]CAG2104880.1 unnamed protein product [Medioppia subpectinata]
MAPEVISGSGYNHKSDIYSLSLIGQCKRIPNLNDSELKAVKAVVKKWQTIEKNEVIYVWHHSEDKDPDYYPDDFTIIENSSDIHHLNYVHSELIPYVASLKWSFSPDYGHEPATVGQGTMTLCVFKRTMATIPFILHQWSPVSASLAVGTEHSFGGVVLSVAICVPIRHDQTLMTTLLYTKRSIISSLFPLGYHYFLLNQISGDIMIWINSQRPKRPVFTRNDETIDFKTSIGVGIGVATPIPILSVASIVSRYRH